MLLLFNTESRKRIESEEVHALIEYKPEDLDNAVMRKIEAFYVNGYSIIDVMIKGATSRHLNLIGEKARRNLIGAEIVENTTQGFSLQILLGDSGFNLDEGLKRLCDVTSLMFRQAVWSLKTSEKNLSTEVIEQHEVHRLVLYLRRRLSSVSHGTSIEPEVYQRGQMGFTLVFKALLDLSDEAAKIVQIADDVAGTFGNDLLEQMKGQCELACGLVDAACAGVLNEDVFMAERAMIDIDLLNEKDKQLRSLIWQDEGSETDSKRLALSLLDSLRAVSKNAFDISGIVLDLNVEKLSNVQKIELAQRTIS